MNKGQKSSANKLNKGFTLLEVVITLVLIAIVGSIVIVGLASLSGIGQEQKTIKDAQMAQRRMELILAEKRHSGFPSSTQDADGPDPCRLYDLNINNYSACNSNKLTVEFTNGTTNSCYDNSTNNCTVTVLVTNGPEFKMRLYNFGANN